MTVTDPSPFFSIVNLKQGSERKKNYVLQNTGKFPSVCGDRSFLRGVGFLGAWGFGDLLVWTRNSEAQTNFFLPLPLSQIAICDIV